MLHRLGAGRRQATVEYHVPHHPGMIIKYRPGGRRRAPPRPVPFGPLLTTPLAVLIVLGSPVEAVGDMVAAPVDSIGWTAADCADSCDLGLSVERSAYEAH
jgi:hypothetical protein